MNKFNIKQGPIAFIKQLFIMETALVLFLIIISYLEHYELLFQNLNFHTYVRYDLFILIVSSLFQIFYIVAIFLNWYFSYYEISKNELIKRTGILFNRKKYIPLNEIESVETYESLTDKLTGNGTIILEKNNGKVIRITDVYNFEEYVNILKANIKHLSKDIKYDAKYLIKQKENKNLEFKETLRFDIKKVEVNKELEKVIAKTIIGFLNAEGGNLIIGVSDKGEIRGLEKDINTLPKKDIDGFQNHLTMIIKTMIGVNFLNSIDVNFETIEEKDVCVISVKKGHKPAYLKNQDNKEEFFVRVGNSTQPLSMSEAEEYIKEHF